MFYIKLYFLMYTVVCNIAFVKNERNDTEKSDKPSELTPGGRKSFPLIPSHRYNNTISRVPLLFPAHNGGSGRNRFNFDSVNRYPNLDRSRFNFDSVNRYPKFDLDRSRFNVDSVNRYPKIDNFPKLNNVNNIRFASTPSIKAPKGKFLKVIGAIFGAIASIFGICCKCCRTKDPPQDVEAGNQEVALYTPTSA